MTSNILRSAQLGAALSLAALLIACDGSVLTHAAAARSGDAGQVEKSLRAAEADWNAQYRTRDLAKLAAHYAPEATMMQPGVPVMTGSDMLTQALHAFIADPALDMRFHADKVGVAQGGDLAYTRGVFKLTSTNPTTGKPTTQTGSYLTVYQRQADGSWKAIEDIASPTTGHIVTPTAS